ncbi:MAG: hypothetical protein ABJP34_13280 [Erythrobacter sp.]
MRYFLSSFLALSAFGALSACSGTAEEEDVNDTRDPLIEQALGDQLLADLDLASQNEANAALTVGFDSSIPPLPTGPESRAKARTAMRALLLEGGEIVDLPEANKDAELEELGGALTAAELASRVGFAKECAERLNYSAIWAARLPDQAAIAPGGAVIEAAGNPQKQCNIRIVTYVTDLPVDEALQFHFNMARRAELKPAYFKGDGDGAESAVQAISGKASIAVHARERGGFQTEVNIVSREYAGK